MARPAVVAPPAAVVLWVVAARAFQRTLVVLLVLLVLLLVVVAVVAVAVVSVSVWPRVTVQARQALALRPPHAAPTGCT